MHRFRRIPVLAVGTLCFALAAAWQTPPQEKKAESNILEAFEVFNDGDFLLVPS